MKTASGKRDRRVPCVLRCILAATLLAAITGSLHGHAQAQVPEADRKAVAKDCYALLQYIRWPNYRTEGTVDEPFHVAVHGDTAFVRVMRESRTVAGINGRTLQIDVFASVADSLMPQVLILAGGDDTSTTDLLGRMRGQLVLTIRIEDQPTESGAVLTLSTGQPARDFSRRVTLDESAAKKSGLNLSPRLGLLVKSQDQ